jgi:ribosomal protein L11 methyltransferase
LIRLAVRVRQDQAEIVLAELLELAPSGVEEVSLPDGVVEYAVYGPPGEVPLLPDLRAAAGEALVDISTSEIADDWADRWRSFHKPLVLDGRLTVRPPWEPAAVTPLDVVIDPGQAFGTGAHATTRLCLELLLSLDSPGGSFLDLGCGSGVLAIVAARLGYAPVAGLDNDPAAIEATLANAAVNEVAIEARRFDLRTDPTPDTDLVVANLLAPLLLEWAPRASAPRVIASGILAGEADRVAAAFAAAGMHERERRWGGEWVALLLARDTAPVG